MNPRVSHLGVFKYDVFQLHKGRNREKRSSVIEIILKTAGFRINVLSNLWDSGKHHFHGWKKRGKDEDVLEPD